jgi:hypothetical protein
MVASKAQFTREIAGAGVKQAMFYRQKRNGLSRKRRAVFVFAAGREEGGAGEGSAGIICRRGPAGVDNRACLLVRS